MITGFESWSPPAAPAVNLSPHRPHLASLVANLASSTRFFAPQLRHATTCIRHPFQINPVKSCNLVKTIVQLHGRAESRMGVSGLTRHGSVDLSAAVLRLAGVVLSSSLLRPHSSSVIRKLSR